MTDHTPTPWRAEPNGWTPWDGAIGILPLNEDEDSAVAWTTSGSNEPANAAFIVKAVNAHEALVKALKLARERISFLGLVCTNSKHFEANRRDFLPVIDAAIALAKNAEPTTADASAERATIGDKNERK